MQEAEQEQTCVANLQEERKRNENQRFFSRGDVALQLLNRAEGGWGEGHPRYDDGDGSARLRGRSVPREGVRVPARGRVFVPAHF